MTLKEAFMSLEDARNPPGRRYKLSSIFNMLLASLISGHNRLTKIAQWIRSVPLKMNEGENEIMVARRLIKEATVDGGTITGTGTTAKKKSLKQLQNTLKSTGAPKREARRR
jgi:hypothetical protein